MLGKLIFMNLRSILACCALLPPLFLHAQTAPRDANQLQLKIDELSRAVEQLKAEKSLSGDIDKVLLDHSKGFTIRDSLRLVSLKRKQEESRARIDALTMEIIRISKQLEDPRKRFALAKKMKEEQVAELSPPQEKHESEPAPLDTISAQAIDLEAVKLVREGKTLDQARLLVIDKFSETQVLDFYQSRSKEDRYALYDISDNIIRTEGADVTAARRTAIFFHLFTNK